MEELESGCIIRNASEIAHWLVRNLPSEFEPIGGPALTQAIKKPAENLETIQMIYIHLCSTIFQIPVRELFKVQLPFSENIRDYDPDLYGEGQQRIILCFTVSYVFNSIDSIAKPDDDMIFTIKDIITPSVKCTCRHISVLISCCDVLRNRQPHLQVAFEDHESKKHRRVELAKEIAEYTRKLADEKARRAENQGTIDELRAKLEVLRDDNARMTADADKTQKACKVLKKAVDEEEERLKAAIQEKEALETEALRLDSQIINSPDRVKQEVVDSTQSVKRLESELTKCRDEMSGMLQREKDLSSSIRQIQSLLADLDKCQEKKKKQEELLEEGRGKEEEIENTRQQVHVTQQELKNLVGILQTKTESLVKLKKQHEDKLNEMREMKKYIERERSNQQVAEDQDEVAARDLDAQCHEIRNEIREMEAEFAANCQSLETAQASILHAIDSINEQQAEFYLPLVKKLCPHVQLNETQITTSLSRTASALTVSRDDKSKSRLDESEMNSTLVKDTSVEESRDKSADNTLENV